MALRTFDADPAELARILRQSIDADRFPLSPRVQRWKGLLAKIDPEPPASSEPGVNRAWTPKKGQDDMAEADNAAVLDRAKRGLPTKMAFSWDLEFGGPGIPRAKIRGQYFLSREQREEYLERARVELRKEASSA